MATVPLSTIEAELQAVQNQLSQQTVTPTQQTLSAAARQLQAGIAILGQHSASSVAGSLYSDAMVQFLAARDTLRTLL